MDLLALSAVYWFPANDILLSNDPVYVWNVAWYCSDLTRNNKCNKLFEILLNWAAIFFISRLVGWLKDGQRGPRDWGYAKQISKFTATTW